MPPPNITTEAWTPEPELRESPPRRSASLEEDYPDLNRPSMLFYAGVGGVLCLVGLIMLVAGFAGQRYPLGIAGIVLALGGAVLGGMYPAKVRSHEARIEQLITYGVPVVARVLHADNMTGDATYARTLKYQVVLPGGDIAHRSVNCDERRLPKAIPCDATALMDMNTSDVELYCALPMRAVPKGAPVSRIPTTPTVNTAPVIPTVVTPTPVRPLSATGALADVPISPSEALANTNTPPPADGHMGTLNVTTPTVPRPVVEQPVIPAEPVVETPPEKPKKKPVGTSGLPWE